MGEEAIALDRMCEAFNKVLVAGNHVALCVPDDLLPYETHSSVAFEKYGAGRDYEMWVAWAGIMRQRDAVGDLIQQWQKRTGHDGLLNYKEPNVPTPAQSAPNQSGEKT